MKYIKETLITKFEPFKTMLPMGWFTLGSSFAYLLQLDREMAKKRLTAEALPGMKGDINRDERRPWHVIPNIRKFDIKLMPYDWLLLLFGLFKKYKPTTKFYAWRNSGANHYIDYMFKRLKKQVELKEYTAAVKTMWLLMKSEAYQVSAMNHVLRNWHRKLKYVDVKRTFLKVKKLCNTKSTDLLFSRVYILKDAEDPSKGFRPLGVPKWEWRVYLHMYNNLITEWRLVTEGNNQHGYIPQRGVITAWTELIPLLKRMPNIYEADFKGFFDSIDLNGLTQVLTERLGLPQEEADFIEQINKSLVELPDPGTDRMYEKERAVPFTKDGQLNPQSDDFWTRDFSKGHNLPKASKPMTYSLGPDLWDLTIDLDLTKTHGVPQGAATSCALATLAFRPLEELMDQPIPKRYVTDKTDENYGKEIKLPEDPNLVLEIIKDIKGNIEWELNGRVNAINYYKERGDYETAKHYEEWYEWRPNQAKILKLKERMQFWEERLNEILEYRGLGRILFYADDVIYFPHNPDEDVKQTLENPKLGIKVNESKSHWSKRNGEWLVEHIKFLGMRYYPSKPMEVRHEDLGIILCLTIPLDIILFSGWPIFTVLGLLSQAHTTWERSRERFVADTRKGATLEFTDKESFLIYLDNSRNNMNSGSMDEETVADIIRKGLKHWISDNETYWTALKSKTQLLWKSGLKGYIFSRMQSDDWHVSRDQDFRLNPKPKSWVWEEWPRYAYNWGLPRYSLNVFNCSSFACHGLLEWALRLRRIKRRGKPKVRYVFSEAKDKQSKRRRPSAVRSQLRRLWRDVRTPM